MILTLVPNPSLDKIVTVPGFTAGGAFHASEVRRYAGGKGFHVARALRTLGEEPYVICPLGGKTGQIVQQLAQEEGLRTDFIWVEGETRHGMVVVDPRSNQITELYEPGPIMTEDDWHRLEGKVLKLTQEEWVLAVSGSLPRGIPDDALVGIIRIARESGHAVLLDTYGPALKQSLQAHPDVVKINHLEANDLTGIRVERNLEAEEAARKIQSLGAGSVVITLGAKGAVGIDEYGRTFAWSAPAIEAVFPVGSGDSFFAGLVYGLTRDQSLKEAARLGVAVGSANALSYGPGVFSSEQVQVLFQEIKDL